MTVLIVWANDCADRTSKGMAALCRKCERLLREGGRLLLISDSDTPLPLPLPPEQQTVLPCSAAPCWDKRGTMLRKALAYAFDEMKADYVLTLPSPAVDWSADELTALQAALKEGTALAVCHKNEPSPLLLGWAFRLLTRFTAGLPCAPWASMRGYSAKCAPLCASVKGEGADYEITLLQAIVTEQLPVKVISGGSDEKDKKSEKKKKFEQNTSPNPVSTPKHRLKTSFFAVLGIFNYTPSLKFTLSSFIAFCIDTALLLMLAPLLPFKSEYSEAIAQAISWLISSQVNFTVNQKLVFHSKGNTWKALRQYYALAIVVFVGKEGLLYVFSTLLSLPLWLSKVICEMTFFLINYFVQKKLIFSRKNKK